RNAYLKAAPMRRRSVTLSKPAASPSMTTAPPSEATRLAAGLASLDRLRLARHRASEHLVHARDRNDLEPTLDAVRDFDKILGVLFGNEHRLDAPTQGREQLLLETGNRPHAAAQCDLAGHGDIAAHRDAGHDRDDRRNHGDAS